MKEMIRDRRQLLAFGILAIMMLLLVLMGTPGREVMIVKAYFWPAAAAMMAVMGLMLLQKPKLIGFLGIGLSLWFVVCTVANGDYYLTYNLRFVFAMWMTYGLCLPLMLLLDGDVREKWLTVFALCYALFMLVLSALCCYAACSGTQILLPAMEGAIGIMQNRLYALCKHPNELGLSMNIAMMCWLFLAMRSRKMPVRLLCVLALLPLAFAIALTASRTSIVIAALVGGVAAMVSATEFLKKHREWLRWLAGGAALVLVTGGLMWTLNAGVPMLLQDHTVLMESHRLIPAAYAEEAPDADQEAAVAPPAATKTGKTEDDQLVRRDFGQSFSTFSMRTGIWKVGVEYIQKHPRVLLLGSTDGQVSRIPKWYLGRNVSHMHNGWLEMLIQTGIPGFLVYLCIILRMLWAAARQFFNLKNPAWQRILAAAPVVTLLCTLMEIYPCVSGNVMDMMYMVLAGAVIALDQKKTKMPDQA